MILRQINADGAETLNASAVFIPALCGNICMNLILGLSIPLAIEQKSFLKVPLRLLQKNSFRPLGQISVAKLFGLYAFSIQKTRTIIAIHYLVFRSSMATLGHAVSKVFTYKQREGIHQKMPFRDIFLVGPCAQSPSCFILELAGLNPSLI